MNEFLNRDIFQFYPISSSAFQSCGSQLHHVFIQSWQWNAVPFRKGLYICAQTPCAHPL